MQVEACKTEELMNIDNINKGVFRENLFKWHAYKQVLYYKI